MKKVIVMTVCMLLSAGLFACAARVPKTQYDAVVAERDALRMQLNLMSGSAAPPSGSQDQAAIPETPSPSPAANIELTQYKLYNTSGNAVVVLLKNTTGVLLGEISVQATFYQGSAMLSAEKESYYEIPPGRDLAYSLRKPADEKGNMTAYDHVDISIYTEADRGFFEDVGTQVTFIHNKGAADTVIKATNNGDKDVTYLKFGVIYYSGGEAVGLAIAPSTETVSRGKSVTLEAGFPYNADFDTVLFDDYTVLLLEAHH